MRFTAFAFLFAVLMLPAFASADDLAARADALTKAMANVESLTDYGGGMTSFYKKSYVFEISEGALVMGEAYLGRNTDDKGVSMEWSGRYVYRIPANVTLGKADYANELFKISCPGKSKCIQYKSINEVTRSRGMAEPKPRNTGGIMRSINVNGGKKRALLDSARKEIAALLKAIGEAPPPKAEAGH